MKNPDFSTLISILLPLSFIGAGCAGFQGLKRHAGPKYQAETKSWQRVLNERGDNGMWLVTRGYHRGDDVVAIATASALSHAAILDLDKQQVIEAVGKGVVATDLKKFLHESHRVVLIQPPGFDRAKGKSTVARARGKIGEGYDFLGTVGLPDDKRWYCSELAVWASGTEVDHIGPKNVLHPKSMLKLGKVLFDTGQRDGQPDK